MSQWHQVMVDADEARQRLLRDRAAGEREFQRLLAAHPGDGMIYFKRGEAYEAIGEPGLAGEDFLQAESLFPLADWQSRARQALARVSAR